MSFDPSLPTDRDRARFRLGDTAEPPYIEDSTYDAILASSASYAEALVTLAYGLAGLFRSLPQGMIKLGDQTLDAKGLSLAFDGLAADLRREAPIQGARAGLIGVDPLCRESQRYAECPSRFSGGASPFCRLYLPWL